MAQKGRRYIQGKLTSASGKGSHITYAGWISPVRLCRKIVFAQYVFMPPNSMVRGDQRIASSQIVLLSQSD